MSFLSSDTMKSLEGKFLKFQHDVPRNLQLLSYKTEQKEFNGETRTVNVISVIDLDVGEEKEFNANKSFMTALSRLPNLEANDVITVYPTAKQFTIDGKTVDSFDFRIEKKQKEEEGIQL